MSDLNIGLIPDGNRRFALKNNIDLQLCYANSVDKALQFADWCYQEGASSVTMYAFSTENFNRSPAELFILYDIFCSMFDTMYNDDKLHYKVLVRGNRDLLKEHFNRSIIDKINMLEEKTATYSDFTIVLLLGYGACDEYLQYVNDGLNPATINEKYPMVNLIIRTANEKRTSNFPFSPNAYFYSCKKYFPLLKRRDLQKALKNYKRNSTYSYYSQYVQ